MIIYVSIDHFYLSVSAGTGIQVQNTVNVLPNIVSEMQLMVHGQSTR
jgi:hypothetical protein